MPFGTWQTGGRNWWELGPLRTIRDDDRLPEAIRRLSRTERIPSVPRVLVAEDTAELAYVLREILSRAGFDVVSAQNGIDAVVLAHVAQPDLVLMDIAMPLLDGIAATSLLRTSPYTAAVPVIAHTAEPSAITADSSLFNAVLEKPIDPLCVVTTITHTLETRAPRTAIG